MDKNVFYHFMYFMYLKNKKLTFQKGKHREERCEELTPQYPTRPDPEYELDPGRGPLFYES